jgi:hypothetical protein
MLLFRIPGAFFPGFTLLEDAFCAHDGQGQRSFEIREIDAAKVAIEMFAPGLSTKTPGLQAPDGGAKQQGAEKRPGL